MSIARNLEILFDKIHATQAVDSSQAVYLMAKCRQYIEETRRQNSYPNLLFYCHWTLHVRLSISAHAVAMLGRLATLAGQYITGNAGQRNLNDEICLVFSVRELRRELIELMAEIQVTDFLFTNKPLWDLFFGLLTRELTEKPVELLEPYGQNRYQNELRRYNQAIADTLQIGFVPKSMRLGILNPQTRTVGWYLEPHSNSPMHFTCRGPMNFTEGPAAFTNTQPPPYRSLKHRVIFPIRRVLHRMDQYLGRKSL